MQELPVRQDDMPDRVDQSPIDARLVPAAGRVDAASTSLLTTDVPATTTAAATDLLTAVWVQLGIGNASAATDELSSTRDASADAGSPATFCGVRTSGLSAERSGRLECSDRVSAEAESQQPGGVAVLWRINEISPGKERDPVCTQGHFRGAAEVLRELDLAR